MSKENLFFKSISSYPDHEVSVLSCRLITKFFIRDIDIFYENGAISHLFPYPNEPILMPAIRNLQANWQIDD